MNVFMMRGKDLMPCEAKTANRFERFTHGKWPFVILGSNTVAIPNEAAVSAGLRGVVNFAEEAMFCFMQRKYRFNISVMDDGCVLLSTNCGIYCAEEPQAIGLQKGQQPNKKSIEHLLYSMSTDVDEDDIIAVINMPK